MMTEYVICKNGFDVEVEIPKGKLFFRPSVYGVAIKDGQILVMDTTSSGKLWLPGGGINLGEKMSDALARELKEETGLTVKNVGDLLLAKENFYYHDPSDHAMHAFTFFYHCEVEPGEISEAGMEENEGAENVRWLTFAEVKEIGFNSLHNELIEAIEKIFPKL